jgi:multiple sugar transport system ATP-binding protein
VYVTHDQVEAMTLGDRAAVMNRGRIQQVDTPQALYWSPANLFVAAFIGSPSMNLIEAEIADGMLRCGGHSFPLEEVGDGARALPKRVVLGFRPEHLTELRGGDTAPWSFEADVSVVEDLGAERLVFFPLDVTAVEPEDIVRIREGEEQAGLMATGDMTILTARLPSTTRHASSEKRIRLALNPSLCYFFDPESGESLLEREPVPDAEVPSSVAGPVS